MMHRLVIFGSMAVRDLNIVTVKRRTKDLVRYA
jgi:hypothetical protein